MLGTEGEGLVGIGVAFPWWTGHPVRPMNPYHLGTVWLLVWTLAAVATMRGCP
jgi:hypothetical protein